MPVREIVQPNVDTALLCGAVEDRPDAAIQREVLRLVECYSGEPGSWYVRVDAGAATIRRTKGLAGTAAEDESFVVRALAHTVPGVVSVRVQGRAPRRAAAAARIPA